MAKALRLTLLVIVLAAAFARGTAVAIPPPPVFLPILPLAFDGASFTVPKTFAPCQRSWPQPPFTSSASGPLALLGSVMLMPGCAPPTASGTPKLYVIAVQLDATESRVAQPSYPQDFGSSFIAVPIAGPANADEDPWIFKPIPGALQLTAGAKFAFFVAVAIR
jgi:hypothetical protein